MTPASVRHAGQGRAGADHFRGADDQGRAGEEAPARSPRLRHRRRARSPGRPGPGLDVEELGLGAHEVADAAMLDLHALGFAGGARGVDDVAEVFRCGAASLCGA